MKYQFRNFGVRRLVGAFLWSKRQSGDKSPHSI
jgi:hypothetical protein